jgi:hypothetical protein
MPTAFGSLRRLVLTPSLAEVTFVRRGFPESPPDVTQRLEAIPQAVICGFEWAIDCRNQWEVERRLSLVTAEHRGFAYEGATMAFTVLDAMAGGRGHRTRDLLRGPGAPHIFLAYIGIGFAMARLPRPLWKKVVPDLTGSPYHPTMSWLAVDGYGFDRAYFEIHRWVEEQALPSPYPFQGRPDYFARAFDQGVGRALWFIHGAQTPAVVSAVGRFAASRQADLWSGVGLAATFAGGSDAEGMAALRRAAGDQWPELAQGAVFAAKARAYSGTVPEHSEVATVALTDMSVDRAAALADGAAVPENAADSHGTDNLPAYELWRRTVRKHFSAALASEAH